MNGSVARRCDCRDPRTGRQYLTTAPKDGERDGRCPRRSSKGHGSWWIRYDVPRGDDSKRRQVREGPFTTKADAESVLHERLDGLGRGTFVQQDRSLTFARYLDEWLGGRVGLKPSTRESYEGHVRVYLKPALGHVRLVDLRDTHFEQMYAAMRQIGPTVPDRPSPTLQRILDARQDDASRRKTPSDATIRRVHATAMSALNNAVRRKKIGRNPAEHVELASGRAPRPVVWTPDRVDEWRRTGKRYPVAVWTPQQAGAFLDATAADMLGPMWALIAYRGLRRSEAVRIDWADVDLEAATLTVRESKTDAGVRTISLDTATVATLRTHRKTQAQRQLAWHGAWVDCGRVFTKEDGSPLNPDSVSQRFDRLVDRHDLPPIRLHDLRHVAASLALAAGVPLKVVSEQLGHSTIGITADIYSSVMPQVAQAAAEAVAALVPRNSNAAAGTTSLCPPGARQAANRAAERTVARASSQVKRGGAGRDRTDDRRIMSPLL